MKIRLLSIAFIFLFLLVHQKSFGQENHLAAFHCASDHMMESRPVLLKEQQALELAILHQAEKSDFEKSATFPYTLPIVVHIIHGNGTGDIPDAQVYQAVQQLNDASKIYFSSIGENNENGFIVSGKRSLTTLNNSHFIAKINEWGTPVWAKGNGCSVSSYNTNTTNIAALPNGGYVQYANDYCRGHFGTTFQKLENLNTMSRKQGPLISLGRSTKTKIRLVGVTHRYVYLLDDFGKLPDCIQTDSSMTRPEPPLYCLLTGGLIMLYPLVNVYPFH